MHIVNVKMEPLSIPSECTEIVPPFFWTRF